MALNIFLSNTLGQVPVCFSTKSHGNGVPHQDAASPLQNQAEGVSNRILQTEESTELPHHAPLGWAVRWWPAGFNQHSGGWWEQEDRLRGVTENPSVWNHVALDPICWNSLGNKNFLGSVFHGNKQVTSLKDSESPLSPWFPAAATLLPWEGRRAEHQILRLEMFQPTGI